MVGEGDLRSDLESAFESVAESDNSEVESTEAAPAEEVEASPKEPENDSAETTEEKPATEARDGRDDKGRFAAKAKPATGQNTRVASLKEPVQNAHQTAELNTSRTEQALRAPQSWKANIREKWAALPSEVQQEVVRREREVAQVLSQAAEARKGLDEFRQAVMPYEAQIRAEGGEPIGAIRSLLQTAQALRTAPPGHRAMLVANMVKAFGVPIDALDQALAGQMPQGQPQQQHLDPNQIAQQVMQHLQAQAGQRLVGKYEAEVGKFAESHEFYDDVHETMATLIEGGLAKGFEDAYNKAVLLHPDISGVIKQRERQAANAKVSTQRARAAASSVKSQPSGIVQNGRQADDLRGTLESVFDDLSQ